MLGSITWMFALCSATSFTVPPVTGPPPGRVARAGPSARRKPRAPRPHAPSEDERAGHDAFLTKLKAPLWQR